MARDNAMLKFLGPGILFACVAVGGANFVQATHVGAEYGLSFLPLIFLIYILKYPFFEFAQRYSASHQETVLEGYQKIGSWALLLYSVLTACMAFPTIAALSLIDANLSAYFLNTTISPLVLSIGILTLCAVLLLFGQYRFLESMMKVIVTVLIACSLITVFIALQSNPKVLTTKNNPMSYFEEFTFFVALMGWMPAPLDASVWLSLWAKAKTRFTKYTPSLKEGLIDFNVGYIISGLLVVIFVLLGAIVMFASNQSFAKSGIFFIEQLITLFTTHIGKGGETFIAIIIFSVLFSATLTCLDAYPRAFTNAITLLQPKYKHLTELIYWFSVILLFLASIILSGYFVRSMKELIDIATIFAFLTAPVFGYLNYLLVTSKKLRSEKATPPRGLVWLSKLGLIFLVVAGIMFIFLFLFPSSNGEKTNSVRNDSNFVAHFPS